MSEGKPINLHMTEFFPGIEQYWHDLGYAHPSFGDMDGDGWPDLIASTEVGTYVFFRRTAMDMDRPPAVEFGEIRIERRE